MIEFQVRNLYLDSRLSTEDIGYSEQEDESDDDDHHYLHEFCDHWWLVHQELIPINIKNQNQSIKQYNCAVLSNNAYTTT